MAELILILAVAALCIFLYRRNRRGPAIVPAETEHQTPAAEFPRPAPPAPPEPRPAEVRIPLEDLVCDIEYEDAKGEPSTRTIQPKMLVSGPNAPILQAFCHKAGKFRAFRTDRIAEVVDHEGEILDIDTYLKRHADIDLAALPNASAARRTPRVDDATIRKAGLADLPREHLDDLPLLGHVVVFTGTLADMSRAEAREEAELLGAEVMGNVTARTTLVVAGDDAGRRLQTALRRGIRVLDEDEWLDLLDSGELPPAKD